MKFLTGDGYSSEHRTVNGIIDLICEGICECEEGYFYESSAVKTKSTESKCRYCYTLEHINEIPLEEKLELINCYGYATIGAGEIYDYDLSPSDKNSLNELYFNKCCDECGSEDNLELVDRKYYLCLDCRNKYVLNLLEKHKEGPYIVGKVETIIEKKYNPNYGDDRICKCGHPYYRHFDSYDDEYYIGCKYCSCSNFVEI